MNKEKKKLKRMEDDDEGEEWNDLSATSSKVLRALLASPPDSIGRCGRQNKSDGNHNLSFTRELQPLEGLSSVCKEALTEEMLIKVFWCFHLF